MKDSTTSRPPTTSSPAAQSLCLSCGLCCDGTLFGSVELQLADDAESLRELGLKISTRGKPRFPQPCSALGSDGCCHVYKERPQLCRAFECALLQSVQRGRIEPVVAARIIRRTRQRAGEVWSLLRELGETREGLALALRFRRLRRQFDQGTFGDSTDLEERMDRFARLTLAVHELQFLLRREFYPDPSDRQVG